MHISWLRKKLGDDAANPRYIATVRGRRLPVREELTAQRTGTEAPPCAVD
ncbi:hypothetical protein GCM10020221_10710 [Streptomyces thioluteus]|uniref:OmpR/PhoB-type domain-containing protein n=1 Tax=Streptomyces thioluteus TaxID=66431 RepID=A0ABN3WJ04_STRTU